MEAGEGLTDEKGVSVKGMNKQIRRVVILMERQRLKDLRGRRRGSTAGQILRKLRMTAYRR
jgi:hypothetical protein